MSKSPNTSSSSLSETTNGLERIVSPLQLKPFDLLVILREPTNSFFWPDMLFEDYRYLTENWALAFKNKNYSPKKLMVYLDDYKHSQDSSAIIAIKVLYDNKILWAALSDLWRI